MVDKAIPNKFVGQRHCYLTVLNTPAKIVTHSGGSTSTYVPVRCDCGVEKFTQMSSLRSGDIISCGCALGKEHKRQCLLGHTRVHGMTGTRTYSIWKGMRKRCNNKNEPSYPNYGGRGIIVCSRWSDFTLFHLDMGDCPIGFSIERDDVDGNYEPSNCRWIPKAEQPLNRRYNKTVTLRGENLLFSHALQVLDVKKSTGNNYRVRHNLTHQQTLDYYVANCEQEKANGATK